MWRIHERAGLHVHTSSDVIADAVVELRLSLGRAALTTPGRVVHTMTPEQLPSASAPSPSPRRRWPNR